MKPLLFFSDEPHTPERIPAPHTHRDVTRVEVPVDSRLGTFMLMILDADDTVDLVVQYPDGEREIVWALIKGET